MSPLIDLIGKRFGHLLVIERMPDPDKLLFKKFKKNVAWKCKCDCGNEKIALSVRLRNGQCRSCGCLQKKETGKRFTKHGLSKTLEYRLLKCAKKRAREFNIGYNIDLSDISIPSKCPILDIPLISSNGGKSTNNSPSLDRVDPL